MYTIDIHFKLVLGLSLTNVPPRIALISLAPFNEFANYSRRTYFHLICSRLLTYLGDARYPQQKQYKANTKNDQFFVRAKFFWIFLDNRSANYFHLPKLHKMQIFYEYIHSHEIIKITLLISSAIFHSNCGFGEILYEYLPKFCHRYYQG